jgi:hypothetical protein
MASLAEIRAKLKAQETRSERSSGGDNAIYPHWNIPEGSTAVVRFLPDADETNTFFWKERLMIRLPFNGVKGDMNSKPLQVQVPCVEMWGDTCPVLSEVRGWFKDPSLEDMGRKYWKKRSYIFQGFVTDNPMVGDTEPDNPIRRFVISPSIFNIIKDALMDPDIQELPTDYDMGLDFRITKTTKGQYADYSTSKWSRKESAITEVQRAAVDVNGLHTLNDFLPKRPNEVELGAIKEMFEASVDGQPYDVERFGQYYRPYGIEAPAGTPAPAAPVAVAPSAPAATAPVTEEVVAPVAPVAPVAEVEPEVVAPVATPTPAPAGDSGGKSAEDILAMIRSRQKA